MEENKGQKAPLRTEGKMTKRLREEERVTIVIEQQENFEGSDTVKLGIEGFVIEIMRGYEVAIPKSFVGLLGDLKYTILSKNEKGEDISREVPRFAWRRVA